MDREAIEAMESMLAFINLPWTRAFDKHFSKQKLNTRRTYAFERDLLPRQIAEFESSLAEKLANYDYLPLRRGV